MISVPSDLNVVKTQKKQVFVAKRQVARLMVRRFSVNIYYWVFFLFLYVLIERNKVIFWKIQQKEKRRFSTGRTTILAEILGQLILPYWRVLAMIMTFLEIIIIFQFFFDF